MPELRDHHQQALRPAVVDGEVHSEVLADWLERFRENLDSVRDVSVCRCSCREGGTEVEIAADVVIELLVLHDVEAAVSQERRNGPDNAWLVRAGQAQDEFGLAGCGGCGCGTRRGGGVAGWTAFKKDGHGLLLNAGVGLGRGGDWIGGRRTGTGQSGTARC